jgi:hypothetical protein
MLSRVDPAPYLPLATAVFTFGNTLMLLWLRRSQSKVHKRIDGLYMQNVYEAEERGRRLERHRQQTTRLGE